MKKIILISFLILFLTSCWSNDSVSNDNEKKDFNINTVNYNNLSNVAYLEKSWKISSSQKIDISSNVSWRISTVNVKEWDNVYVGQTLAVIEDNIANFWLALETAKNNLEKAKLNYESTEVSLNKAISDIERNLSNLELTSSNSQSKLDLEKINNSISRLEIEYDNLLVSNNQTINWFKNNVEKEYVVINSFLDDVIDFWDSLLGVTDIYDVDDFDTFLGAKDRNQKNNTKQLLINIINYKAEKIDNIDVEFSSDINYDNYLEDITKWYKFIDTFLIELDLVLYNSIDSIWTLSQSQIDLYKSKVSSFQSLSINYQSGFIWLKNSISNFTETYKKTEESLLKQITNLETDKNILYKSVDTNQDSLKASLNEAKINKEISLKNLQLNINDAEIAYSQALKNYNKLFITSPINWVVSEVYFDKWQEINQWANLFSIYSEKEVEVTISFSSDELKFIKLWTPVFYYNKSGEKFTWSIYSINKNADDNLKYISKVSMSSNIDYVWNIIDLQIPVNLDNKLIDLDYIEVSNNNSASLFFVTSSWTISSLNIKTWNVFWDKIEILDWVYDDTEIVTSYIDNYEKEKFNLIINSDINE